MMGRPEAKKDTQFVAVLKITLDGGIEPRAEEIRVVQSDNDATDMLFDLVGDEAESGSQSSEGSYGSDSKKNKRGKLFISDPYLDPVFPLSSADLLGLGNEFQTIQEQDQAYISKMTTLAEDNEGWSIGQTLENGFTVYRKKFDDVATAWMRSSAEVDASAEQIFDWYSSLSVVEASKAQGASESQTKAYAGRCQFFSHREEGVQLDGGGKRLYNLVYRIIELPWPLSVRDGLVFEAHCLVGDGRRYICYARMWQTDKLKCPRHGFVSFDHEGALLANATNEDASCSKVVQLGRLDMGGSVPGCVLPLPTFSFSCLRSPFTHPPTYTLNRLQCICRNRNVQARLVPKSCSSHVWRPGVGDKARALGPQNEELLQSERPRSLPLQESRGAGWSWASARFIPSWTAWEGIQRSHHTHAIVIALMPLYHRIVILWPNSGLPPERRAGAGRGSL